MIICDTHVMIHWSLAPERLSPKAVVAIEQGRKNGTLACADISLWEIAMLAARGRIKISVAPAQFIQDVLLALGLQVLPITPEVAARSQDEQFLHGDPADRLIAATTLVYQAQLITADGKLAEVPGLPVIW